MTVAWKPTIMTRLHSIMATKGQHLLVILMYTYSHAHKVHRYLQIRLQEKVFEENLRETERHQKTGNMTEKWKYFIQEEFIN